MKLVSVLASLGLASMGTGIAQVAAAAGFQVILIDVDEKALSKAMERTSAGFDRLVGRRQMSPEAKQQQSVSLRPEQATMPSHRPISSWKPRRKTRMSK